MSKYSETMGSFTRNGNYPLEADYIFGSEQELKDFFSDTHNKTLLHKGLFKIVAEINKQTLYWIVQEEGELIFRPLVSSESLTDLWQKIRELETIVKDIDSECKEQLNKLINTNKELQALVGTEDDIIETLKGLPYHNFIEVVNALYKLANSESSDNSDTISKLQSLYNNLQKELNQTQTGVGLDQSGAYSPDQETYYLKNATSIMNALKTLDRILHKQANLKFEDTNTIDLEVVDDEETATRTITAQVRLAEDNDIQESENGLYHKVDMTFNNGELTLLVNGQQRAVHNIGLDSVLESSRYDKETETIILVFKLHNGQTQEFNIPVADIITEWETGNTNSIELIKQRKVNGTDRLLGNIIISPKENNGISSERDGIFMSKDAADLTYNDTSVEEALDSLNQTNTDLEERVTNIEDDIYESEIKFVDLGLPSGLLWADRNLGAEYIEDPGLYFCYGETQGYTREQIGVDRIFDSAHYNHEHNYNSYLNDDDDAVIFMLGESYKTPTIHEYEELIKNTTPKLVLNNDSEVGIASVSNGYYKWETHSSSLTPKGVKFINKSDDTKFIFIPIGGQAKNSTLDSPSSGPLLSRGPVVQSGWGYNNVYHFYFDTNQMAAEACYGSGVFGRPIRPVQYKEIPNNTKFYTKKEVDDKLSNIEIPEIDLDDYVKTDDERLSAATTSKSGLMSSEDKTSLKELHNLSILVGNSDSKTFEFIQDTTGVKLQTPTSSRYSYSNTIPLATSTSSGVMSSEDKQKLDSINPDIIGNILKTNIGEYGKYSQYIRIEDPTSDYEFVTSSESDCVINIPYGSYSEDGEMSSSGISKFTIPSASTDTAGVMSSNDKTFIDSLQETGNGLMIDGIQKYLQKLTQSGENRVDLHALDQGTLLNITTKLIAKLLDLESRITTLETEISNLKNN